MPHDRGELVGCDVQVHPGRFDRGRLRGDQEQRPTPGSYGPLQREVERDATPRRRSNPQLPAMALDDASADCQPSASAATASARCVHRPEDGFLLLGSDADAVVANVESAQRLLGIGGMASS